MKKGIAHIVQEIDSVLRLVSHDQIIQLRDLLLKSSKIFITGSGRSVLVLQTFAKRLMHLGFKTYVIGETTTPPAAADDVLIVGSGSGSTDSVVAAAEKAKQIGLHLALITTATDSPIGRLADTTLRIPAQSLNKKISQDGIKSIQPMGTLYEQSMMILCDYIVLLIMEKTGVSEEEMFRRHANIE